MEEVCFCCGNAERGEALLVYSAGSRIHIEWGLENQSGKARVATGSRAAQACQCAQREHCSVQAPAGRSEGWAGWLRLHFGGGGLLPESRGDSVQLKTRLSCQSLATGLTPAACLRNTASSLNSSQMESGSLLMAMTFSWSLSASILL